MQGLAEQLMTLDTAACLQDTYTKKHPLRLSTLGCAVLSQILALPNVRALLCCPHQPGHVPSMASSENAGCLRIEDVERVP